MSSNGHVMSVLLYTLNFVLFCCCCSVNNIYPYFIFCFFCSISWVELKLVGDYMFSVLMISLIPRPFPPSVFDRILYAKMEGKAWEKESCA